MSYESYDKIKKLLPKKTGLAHGEIKFQFKPEEKAHGYSNVGILYLQKVIETLTNSNIEVLARKHVFAPCGMTNSTFGVKATNSLLTTAKDYASFVKYIMNNRPLEDPFVPRVFMTEDKGRAGLIGIAKGKILDADLSHVAWGLGWGLQTDDKGEVMTAYHSGDMNDCRAWVAMNLNDKTAIVYFANSHNGHILADQITPTTIEVEHAANYFFNKWGFARNFEELGGITNNWGISPSLESKAKVNSPPTSSSVDSTGTSR